MNKTEMHELVGNLDLNELKALEDIVIDEIAVAERVIAEGLQD